MSDQSVDINDAIEDAEYFNRRQERDYDKNRHADYRWSTTEMRDAAAVLAHDELYNKKGLRSHRKERELLEYAANREEDHAIKKILREQRALAVEQAKMDDEWPYSSAPKIESDEELRSRLKRRKIVPPFLVVALVGIVGVIYLSSRDSGGGDQFFATAGAATRSAHVDSASYVDEADREVSMRVKDSDAASTVLDHVEVGTVGGRTFIELKGKGSLTCKIEDQSQRIVAEQTADNRVLCEVER